MRRANTIKVKRHNRRFCRLLRSFEFVVSFVIDCQFFVWLDIAKGVEEVGLITTDVWLLTGFWLIEVPRDRHQIKVLRTTVKLAVISDDAEILVHFSQFGRYAFNFPLIQVHVLSFLVTLKQFASLAYLTNVADTHATFVGSRRLQSRINAVMRKVSCEFLSWCVFRFHP